MFSIIVPVYKAEQFLRPCVDSILAQTYGDFELFLVVDGSPDSSGAICDEYAARDGRVTVIHQPNRGVTAARRAGLDRARADYVCFVDADDTVSPRWLYTIHTCLEENGRPDILTFGYEHDKNDGRGLCRYPPKPAPGLYGKDRLRREIYPYMLWDRRATFFSGLFLGYLWNKVFRRQLLLDHFQQDERITQYEDTSMVFSCLYAAESLFVCGECLYFYRFRPDSAVRRRDEKFLQNLCLVREYMTAHLGREAPETVPQINAYILTRVFHLPGIWRRQGYTFSQTTAMFRSGMVQSGLYRVLGAAGLPLRHQAFILLLRLRLFAPAVLIADMLTKS